MPAWAGARKNKTSVCQTTNADTAIALTQSLVLKFGETAKHEVKITLLLRYNPSKSLLSVLPTCKTAFFIFACNFYGAWYKVELLFL